jgi:NADH:ubiquinone oxidoreductase subunit 2 (subunit N)
VVNAAISSYYYLRIIGTMYMQESYVPVAPSRGRPALAVVVACALLTMLIGVQPGPFLSWSATRDPVAASAAPRANSAATEGRPSESHRSYGS